MGKFEQTLADKEFVVTVELDPPVGADLGPLKELAGQLSGRVDAVTISDNRGAVARLSPLTAAQALIPGGAEVVLTLTCRDRNRLALTSDLLAAKAVGVETVFLVSGDFVTLGDQPGAKPVYDLDSVQALQLAARLADGQAAPFLLGSSFAPGANPLGPQLFKFQKKLEAGAKFFISQPVSSLDEWKGFVDQAKAGETKIIAGVEAAAPEDLDAAAALYKEIKESKLAAGVHLSAPDHQASLTDLLNRCGL